MMVCPSCNSQVDKLVRGVECPHCKAGLKRWRGGLYWIDIGNPAEYVVERFCTLVSTQLSQRAGHPVAFSIPRKSNQYKAEISAAWRYLTLCNHNLDLVLETLKVLFEHKAFAYKTRTSLPYLSRDFIAAKAIAETILEKKKKEEEKAALAYETALQREDIWG